MDKNDQVSGAGEAGAQTSGLMGQFFLALEKTDAGLARAHLEAMSGAEKQEALKLKLGQMARAGLWPLLAECAKEANGWEAEEQKKLVASIILGAKGDDEKNETAALAALKALDPEKTKNWWGNSRLWKDVFYPGLLPKQQNEISPSRIHYQKAKQLLAENRLFMWKGLNEIWPNFFVGSAKENVAFFMRFNHWGKGDNKAERKEVRRWLAQHPVFSEAAIKANLEVWVSGALHAYSGGDHWASKWLSENESFWENKKDLLTQWLAHCVKSSAPLDKTIEQLAAMGVDTKQPLASEGEKNIWVLMNNSNSRLKEKKAALNFGVNRFNGKDEALRAAFNLPSASAKSKEGLMALSGLRRKEMNQVKEWLSPIQNQQPEDIQRQEIKEKLKWMDPFAHTAPNLGKRFPGMGRVMGFLLLCENGSAKMWQEEINAAKGEEAREYWLEMAKACCQERKIELLRFCVEGLPSPIKEEEWQELFALACLPARETAKKALRQYEKMEWLMSLASHRRKEIAQASLDEALAEKDGSTQALICALAACDEKTNWGAGLGAAQKREENLRKEGRASEAEWLRLATEKTKERKKAEMGAFEAWIKDLEPKQMEEALACRQLEAFLEKLEEKEPWAWVKCKQVALEALKEGRFPRENHMSRWAPGAKDSVLGAHAASLRLTRFSYLFAKEDIEGLPLPESADEIQAQARNLPACACALAWPGFTGSIERHGNELALFAEGQEGAMERVSLNLAQSAEIERFLKEASLGMQTLCAAALAAARLEQAPVERRTAQLKEALRRKEEESGGWASGSMFWIGAGFWAERTRAREAALQEKQMPEESVTGKEEKASLGRVHWRKAHEHLYWTGAKNKPQVPKKLRLAPILVRGGLTLEDAMERAMGRMVVSKRKALAPK